MTTIFRTLVLDLPPTPPRAAARAMADRALVHDLPPRSRHPRPRRSRPSLTPTATRPTTGSNGNQTAMLDRRSAAVHHRSVGAGSSGQAVPCQWRNGGPITLASDTMLGALSAYVSIGMTLAFAYRSLGGRPSASCRHERIIRAG